MLILIKPHDDVPKTLLLGQLVPILTALLAEHNAAVARPELRMRLRAVVHAGEVHDDDKGFYGEDLDAAFRLLEAPTAEEGAEGGARRRRSSWWSPRRSSHGIVQQGYLDGASFQPLVRVRVGRAAAPGLGPYPGSGSTLDRPAASRRARSQLPAAPLSIASAERPRPRHPQESGGSALGVNGRGAPRPEPG